jgi:hypothetical protein
MRSLVLALMILPFAALAQTAAKVKKEATETVDASKQYVNEKKEEFEARIEARLAELKAKSKELKDSTESGAKAKLAAIEKEEKAAETRLATLKKAGGSAWKSLRSGVEQAVDDLDKGINGATK